jgi:small GTP-binding protein
MHSTVECKLAVVGDNGVGKSSLCNVFISDAFSTGYNPNEEEIHRQKIRVDDKEILLNIIDINHTSPIFNKVAQEADCFLMVYDVTRKASFEKLVVIHKELDVLKNHSSFPKLIIGNKCDQPSIREVSYEQGLKLSLEVGCHFLEVSAKQNTRVAQAFTQCARSITQEVNSEKSGCCCSVL